MDKGTIVTAAGSGDCAYYSRLWRAFLTLLLFGMLLVGLLDNVARAGELHLLVNGKAIHLDEQENVDYNEKNWGAGFQYDWTERDKDWVPFITASGFDDSNKNASYYAGGGMLRRYHFRAGSTALHADVGFVAFLMKRKDFRNNDPFPGILPAFSFGTERVAVNMTFIPKVDPKMVPILFFQLKLNLGNL